MTHVTQNNFWSDPQNWGKSVANACSGNTCSYEGRGQGQEGNNIGDKAKCDARHGCGLEITSIVKRGLFPCFQGCDPRHIGAAHNL